jgi:hypothetical protein
MFTAGNDRCRSVLVGGRESVPVHGLVEAPYLTPHGCRHSISLYMLVILHYVMDERFGLRPEERRDYRLLGWRCVGDGADAAGPRQQGDDGGALPRPVAALQLRSLLATAPPGQAGSSGRRVTGWGVHSASPGG